MAYTKRMNMANDEFDDERTWEPTDDYPTKKDFEDDNWNLMYPNGMDDGEYFDD